jgi:hypothetical protein
LNQVTGRTGLLLTVGDHAMLFRSRTPAADMSLVRPGEDLPVAVERLLAAGRRAEAEPLVDFEGSYATRRNGGPFVVDQARRRAPRHRGSGWGSHKQSVACLVVVI